jgi:hypothetical protein
MERLRKLLADRKIALELDDSAREGGLGEAGYDPVYGARPLKRVIQHQVQNPLAQRILEGRSRTGRRCGSARARSGLMIGEVGPERDGGAVARRRSPDTGELEWTPRRGSIPSRRIARVGGQAAEDTRISARQGRYIKT